MVGASNVNQVIEKDLDALMDRTKNRPVPTGRMSTFQHWLLRALLTIVGITLLYMINLKQQCLVRFYISIPAFILR
jgi:protoheme IX farnesyltransferase